MKEDADPIKPRIFSHGKRAKIWREERFLSLLFLCLFFAPLRYAFLSIDLARPVKKRRLGEGAAFFLVVQAVVEASFFDLAETKSLIVLEHVDRVVIGWTELRAELASNAGIHVDFADFADGTRLGIGDEIDTIFDWADMDAHLASTAEALPFVDERQHLGLFLPWPGDQFILHPLFASLKCNYIETGRQNTRSCG